VSAPRRICVVTGSRADYGLLYWVMKEIQQAPDLALQLIATGMHLMPAHGHTVDVIVADGFPVDRRVDMALEADTPDAIARAVGRGVIGMTDALADLRPDLVLVLGDRYEILAAAQVCLFLGLPLAHIAGGDTTEGAFDESIRHAITKMAHLHFVTNAGAARRVRQMGEPAERIHCVGSPGLDTIRRMTLLDRTALETALGAPLGKRNLLVTFHPVTLEPDFGLAQLEALLDALDTLPADCVFWVTQANADTHGAAFARRMADWAATRPQRVHLHTSLGQLRYLSLMTQADAVVGNSSSGLYEAPSFKVPTVDIGNRQAGRLAAASVIACPPEPRAIADALACALSGDYAEGVNPYGDGDSSRRIVAILRAVPDYRALLRKSFALLENGHD